MKQPCDALCVDPEFQRLIPPLTSKEFQMLEQNIIRDGCRDPICIWGNVILDGHNRYEICVKHGIQYFTEPINLPSRDAAIAWICAVQIGRRNITEETRKYLIGKRYEAEKKLGAPNVVGANQYTNEVALKICAQPRNSNHRHHTAVALAGEYNLSPSTVQQYGRYASAMDQIAENDDELASRMLSGKAKVSTNSAMRMSSLSDEVLKEVCFELNEKCEDNLPYTESRRIVSKYIKPKPKKSAPSVKDMPRFDPDAEAVSLALTIPSWRSSIEHIQMSESIHDVSRKARSQLSAELVRLSETIESMITVLKGA